MFDVLKVYKKSEYVFTIDLERDLESCSVDILINENTKSLHGDWSTTVDADRFTEDDLCDALGSAACYLESNYYIYCDEDYNWHYTTREN